MNARTKYQRQIVQYIHRELDLFSGVITESRLCECGRLPTRELRCVACLSTDLINSYNSMEALPHATPKLG